MFFYKIFVYLYTRCNLFKFTCFKLYGAKYKQPENFVPKAIRGPKGKTTRKATLALDLN